ncbi:MAG: D-alanine--D-alanine ligase family protein [Myxococcota bacterium]
MKRLRVIVLVHEDLVPPESAAGLSEKELQSVKTEFAVADTLRKMGHEIQVLGVSDDLMPIRRLVDGWRADVVFNLLMEFQNVPAYQAHVASYLELLGVPFTGCNPLGILLSRDKALSKKILLHHRIPTPRFHVLPYGKRSKPPRRALRYPMIVKSVDEEASLGISQASVVQDEEKLLERAAFIHEKVGSAAIAEEYVEGRELTVSVIGNDRLTTFPPWELVFKKLPEGSLPIATEKAKFDLDYQKRVGIDSRPAKLSEAEERRIHRIARRVYRELGLSGYARIDLRMTEEGHLYVIEANATPDIASDEDLALSAKRAGLDYPKLLQRILNLARAYRPS